MNGSLSNVLSGGAKIVRVAGPGLRHNVDARDPCDANSANAGKVAIADIACRLIPNNLLICNPGLRIRLTGSAFIPSQNRQNTEPSLS
jgi:hypothetical protein